VQDFFGGESPQIFAHRGLALAAVENSLEAFRAALSAGATHIETDAHSTRDSVAILFHDEVLAERPISDYLFEELPSYVPSLQQALEAFPYARFNIDIKSVGAISTVADAVTKLSAQDRVLITSFSEKRRSATVSLLPGIASSASAQRFALALIAAKLGLQPLVTWALRGLVAVQIPARALRMNTVTRRTIVAYHRAGVRVQVWTINDPLEMRQLVSIGVDGIVTDRADLAYAEFYGTEQGSVEVD